MYTTNGNQHDLRQRFAGRVDKANACSKHQGYDPIGFKGMIKRSGYIGAAKRLLQSSGPPHEGFRRLEQMGLLGLSVEWIALEADWRELFTNEEKGVARYRLTRAGSSGPPEPV